MPNAAQQCLCCLWPALAPQQPDRPIAERRIDGDLGGFQFF